MTGDVWYDARTPGVAAGPRPAGVEQHPMSMRRTQRERITLADVDGVELGEPLDGLGQRPPYEDTHGDHARDGRSYPVARRTGDENGAANRRRENCIQRAWRDVDGCMRQRRRIRRHGVERGEKGVRSIRDEPCRD